MTFVSLHFDVLEEGKYIRNKEGKFPWLLSTILSSHTGHYFDQKIQHLFA